MQEVPFNAPPRALLVSPLRFIGDIVLTVPLLRALRAQFPQTRLDILLPEPLENLLTGCPDLDYLYPVPENARAYRKRLHQGGYDGVILMRRSVTEAFWAWQAGIPVRIGYDDQRWPLPLGYRRWGLFLTHRVRFPDLDTDTPQVRTYLDLLPVAPQTPSDETLRLWTDPDDKAFVDRWLAQRGEAGPLVVFHGTSASRQKVLPPETWIPTLRYLHEQGIQPIAIGSASEAAYYDTLAALAGVPLENGCGQTTLRQSVALLAQATMLISLDSGPVHMAVATGTPYLVVVYGPTNDRQWRPYPYAGKFTPVFHPDLTCRPCAPRLCAHNRCRLDLDPEAIRRAVQQQWESRPHVLDPTCSQTPS